MRTHTRSVDTDPEKNETLDLTMMAAKDEENAIRDRDFGSGNDLYAKLQRLAGRFGVEQRGIERVPSDERADKGLSRVGTLWMSANLAVSTFAVGAIAVPVFGLGFVDAALVIILVTLLGVMPVCFFSTLGPVFGLRQMVLSRFYFGYYGVKLAAVLNIVSCIGWSAVNVVVAAQLMHAVNADVPGWASILILGVCTLAVSMFGYRAVHVYERWSWLPCLVVFLIVLTQFARSGQFASLLPLSAGAAEASSVLSFASAVFGFASGWCVFAADYTVYQPPARSRPMVFLWTFAGMYIPLIFLELLGAAVATATVHNDDYRAAYESSAVGGLLAQALVPSFGRFGEFCLVVLALSAIANNCPNIYSVSLNLQVLARRTQRVPRFVWTLLSTCAYLAIAIPGYSDFSTWLDSFLLSFSYWLAIYEAVSLSEHFVFRRGTKGYRPEDYTSPHALPPGFAAVAAFFVGVGGAILGMAQPWFVGPIAKLCGVHGGDLGFELAFILGVLSYLPLRVAEKGYFGR
ncbi:purine-cytosine permease [Echria macrotheca]|uniref:Purine-cytosine permease n=1 Tax=Echria macrotheca TaxID=438768 RepID=A0AAJ0BDD1_9PEZI|nr:purine-cytosine permease [Echria macrotheca]